MALKKKQVKKCAFQGATNIFHVTKNGTFCIMLYSFNCNILCIILHYINYIKYRSQYYIIIRYLITLLHHPVFHKMAKRRSLDKLYATRCVETFL